MSPTTPQQPSTPTNKSSQKRHRGVGLSSPATPTPDLRVKRQRPPRRVTSPNSCPGHGGSGSDSGSDGHDDGDAAGQRQSDTSARRQKTPLTSRPPTSHPAVRSMPSLVVPGIGEGNLSRTRSEIRQRSVSAPATATTTTTTTSRRGPTSEISINRNIDQILRFGAAAAARVASSETAAVGFNYIFVATRAAAPEDPSTPPTVLYKVGMSETPGKRAKTVGRVCRFTDLDEVPGAQMRPIRLHKVVERLMHAELAGFRDRSLCLCGKIHKEFYRVDDVETLLACQRRWHAFCESEPWDEDGQLRPWWLRRLNAQEPAAAGCGYKGIAGMWDAFVRPTSSEKLASGARQLKKARLSWWHVITLVQAGVVDRVSWSFWAGRLWLLFVVACVIAHVVRPHEFWSFSSPRRFLARPASRKAK